MKSIDTYWKPNNEVFILILQFSLCLLVSSRKLSGTFDEPIRNILYQPKKMSLLTSKSSNAGHWHLSLPTNDNVLDRYNFQSQRKKKL